MKSIFAALVLVSGYCALSQTFTNGSFEIPGGIPEGTSHPIDDLGSPLVGWSIGGSGGMANLVHGQIPGVGVDFPPVTGEFHIAFNGGDSPAGRSISQTFSTGIGAEYAVSFYVGKIGTGSVSLGVTVVASNGLTLTNYTAVPPSHGYGTEQRITFIATTPQTTLTLLDTSPNTVAVDLLLDAVSVIPLQPICSGRLYRFTTNSLWDFSGVYSDNLSTAGVKIVSLQLLQSARGRITGQRSTAITNDTFSMAGTVGLSGTVSTTHGELRVRYSYFQHISGTYNGDPASIRGPLRWAYSLDGTNMVGAVSGSECLYSGGHRQCHQGRIENAEALPLAGDMTGEWALCLDVNETGRRVRGTATVTLSNGRQVFFTVSGTRRPSGNAALILRGTGGARGTLLNVGVDQSMNLKTARGTLFGQRVSVQR